MKASSLYWLFFVVVMAVGTVPDTAGVGRPSAGIYAKSSITKPNEKYKNIVNVSSSFKVEQDNSGGLRLCSA